MTAPASSRQQPSSGEQAQAAQIGLAAVLAAALLQALPSLDLADTASVERFTTIVEALVSQYGAAAAELAVQDYVDVREAAGVARPFTPAPAELPDAQSVQAAVEWAVREAIVNDTDPGGLQQAMTGSAQKLVQDAARATVIDNVHRDPEAKAWARVPEPQASESGTCAFCALLATRGAVYKKDTAGFKAHLNCYCHPEPVFGAYEPNAQIRAWQALYRQHVTEAGRRGRDARIAFRQAVEGRPVTGTKKPALAKGKPTGPRQQPEHVGAVPNHEQAQRMIRLLEQSNERASDNPKLADMIAANNARIGELRAI